MVIFNGKEHAQKIDTLLRSRLTGSTIKGEFLIVLIGDNPISQKYIKIKTKLFENFRIVVKFVQIDSTLSDSQIVAQVEKEFNSSEVSGGLVQIPLPRESLKQVLKVIPSEKDVDLISSTSIEQMGLGDFSRLTPVVRAFNYFALTSLLGVSISVENYLDVAQSTLLLKQYILDKEVTIIGDGPLVGIPIYNFLTHIGAHPILNKNYTSGDKIYSDFLILGAGVANLVSGEDISDGCTVLDFGISVINDKVVGDLNSNSKLDYLGLVALSPGGIGSVVVRFLLLNFLRM